MLFIKNSLRIIENLKVMVGVARLIYITVSCFNALAILATRFSTSLNMHEYLISKVRFKKN